MGKSGGLGAAGVRIGERDAGASQRCRLGHGRRGIRRGPGRPQVSSLDLAQQRARLGEQPLQGERLRLAESGDGSHGLHAHPRKDLGRGRIALRALPHGVASALEFRREQVRVPDEGFDPRGLCVALQARDGASDGVQIA